MQVNGTGGTIICNFLGMTHAWKGRICLLLAVTVSSCSNLAERAIDPSLVGSTNGSSDLVPSSGNGGYQVTRYLWDLEISEDLGEVVGFAATEATATMDLQRFSLDVNDLEVNSVEVDIRDSSHVIEGTELIITVSSPIPVGTSFIVEIRYKAQPAPYLPEGAPRESGWVVTPDVELLVFGGPGSFATWVPYNGERLDTARYVLRLRVPDGYVATSSGVLVDTISGDETEFVWDTIDEVPFVMFSVARYSVTTLDGDVPVDLATRVDDPPQRFADWLPEMLTFLEGLYGPLPQRQLGVSVVEDRGFALASPGRIFVPSRIPPEVLVHELAHQWIGNAVIAEEEAGSWIIEGLPVYTEVLWQDHKGPAITIDKLLERRVLAALDSSTRPLDEVDSIADLHDVATYERGALVFHALRLEIGDDAFFATLRTLVDRHRRDPLSMAELEAIAEELSGTDLGDFFTSWVRKPTIPALPGS